MSLSSSVAGWIAIGAAAAALAGIALAVVLYLRLRRIRDDQAVVLAGGRTDIVEFAVSLQGRIDDLHRAVDEIAAGLARVDRRADESVAKTGLVRYDAYGNAGGQQSTSIALLDSARSGIVLSAIQGRDYARIYLKELDRGRASVSLSPEELEAVERAMSR